MGRRKEHLERVRVEAYCWDVFKPVEMVEIDSMEKLDDAFRLSVECFCTCCQTCRDHSTPLTSDSDDGKLVSEMHLPNAQNGEDSRTISWVTQTLLLPLSPVYSIIWLHLCSTKLSTLFHFGIFLLLVSDLIGKHSEMKLKQSKRETHRGHSLSKGKV
ncbi:hypothetical protein ZEAMMB73_Zm00001d030867 [Zea mays]|uniref:Uncharacterized protein n=1 Tax=Zea mays TaxID=4577 RepID=A0A1D6KEQ9_MAIZE|nr:hypothetical protein ZEAMMB73_Zm00001d030867 [Zea mays]